MPRDRFSCVWIVKYYYKWAYGVHLVWEINGS